MWLKILFGVIYFILAILINPLWPFESLCGKLGCVGYVILVAWLALGVAAYF